MISKYNINTCILLGTYSVPDALYQYMFDPHSYSDEAVCFPDSH